MDIGLLLLRFVIAAVLFAHATQKGLGWFSGPGRTTAATMFESLGHHPGHVMVTLAVSSELIAAALLALGAATPVGAAIAAGTMGVAAVSATRRAGTVWTISGGGEYPFVLAGTALALAFTGPGVVSVDRVLTAPWHEPSSGAAVAIGLASTAVAVASTVPPLRRSAVEHPEHAPDGGAPTSPVDTTGGST